MTKQEQQEVREAIEGQLRISPQQMLGPPVPKAEPSKRRGDP